MRPFRQALACLTDAYLADERPANRRAALLFPAANANRGYIRLASQHPQLRGIGFLEFRFIHGYTLAQHDEGWDAHTTSYAYEFQHPDGREIVAYHYEPGPNSRVKTPHCHVRGLTGPLPLSKAHFPTGRISIEEIIRFAITELGVPPRYPHGDWQARLDQTAAAFFAQRRW